MIIYPTTNREASNNLTANLQDRTLIKLKTLFYGDVLEIEIYPHDAEGNYPTAYTGATYKVAIGDLTPQRELYLENTVTHTSGASIVTTFDLSTAEFEDATEGLLETDILLEIEVNYGSRIKTLTQAVGKLRNQLLLPQTVDLVVPLAPSNIIAELGVLPLAPTNVESEVEPLAPSAIYADLYSAPRKPLAPSAVQATYETEPDAPSIIDAQIVTVPNQPNWVVATSFAIAPSNVEAELLSPEGISNVTAVNLYNVNPLAVTPVSIGTIPLEPSLLSALSSPLAPSSLQTDISPLEPSSLVAYDYNNRPAGFPFGAPTRPRAIILHKAGNNDGSGKPTNVEAVLDSARLPNFPVSAYGQPISSVESELLTPPAPSNIEARSDALVGPHELNAGDMHGELRDTTGNLQLAGTALKLFVDTSGSMDPILPAVRAGVGELKQYLNSVLYGGGTQANNLISSAINFGGEDWLNIMKGSGDSHRDEVVIAFINESTPVYHSTYNLTSERLFNTIATQHVTAWKQLKLNANIDGAIRRGFCVGFKWTVGSSLITMTEAFEQHLQEAFRLHNLENFGLNAFMEYDYNAGTPQATQFIVDYLNIPQEPSEIAYLTVRQYGAKLEDAYNLKLEAPLQGRTGSYNNSATDKVDYTQENWQIEIALDGSTVEDSITIGTVLPNTYQLQDLGSAQESIYVRLVAKGLTGYADFTSAWVEVFRKPQAPSNVQATI